MLVNQNQFGRPPAVPNRDVWQETEAISGSARDDVLRGDDTVPREVGGVGFTGCDVLDQTGVDRIAGLAALLPQPLTEDAGPVVARAKPGGCPLSGPVWGEGNILLGGPGSDTLEGRGGNDILDGDRALSVHISVRTDPADPGTETGWTDLMEHQATSGTFGPGTAGMTLQQAVFAGLVDPGNLTIVRQIDTPAAASTAGDTDVAVFEDVQANYDCTTAGVTAPCGTTSDGSTTLVVHARGSGTDGTDTLRNIERLEFSNGVPPDAPTIGEVVAGDRAATVSWTAPPGPVTGFSLETWAADGTVGVLHSAAGTARTLTIPGLTNGTAYRFRVRALKGALSSPFSAMSAPVTPTAPAGPTPSPSSTPAPSATATPTAPAPATGAADSVALISTLTSRQSCVRCPAALRGTVAPFNGVTLALEQQMPDGTFRTVTEQVISGSATSGRFSFSLDTATSGWSSYRVVVSGAGVRTTAGPVRTLGVFRTRIVDVSPRGREFVALRNSGTIVTQLEGWRLRDRSGRSLTLPQLALAPGATVRVYTGSGRQTRHRVFLGRAADIWAPGHDTVRLRDSRDRPITSRRY